MIKYKILYSSTEQSTMKSSKEVVKSFVALAKKWLDGHINQHDITIVSTIKN
jgi:hemerythrin